MYQDVTMFWFAFVISLSGMWSNDETQPPIKKYFKMDVRGDLRLVSGMKGGESTFVWVWVCDAETEGWKGDNILLFSGFDYLFCVAFFVVWPRVLAVDMSCGSYYQIDLCCL